MAVSWFRGLGWASLVVMMPRFVHRWAVHPQAALTTGINRLPTEATNGGNQRRKKNTKSTSGRNNTHIHPFPLISLISPPATPSTHHHHHTISNNNAISCLSHPVRTVNPTPSLPNRQPAPRAHAKAWPAKHSAAWLRIMLKWGERGWGLPRGVLYCTVLEWPGRCGAAETAARDAGWMEGLCSVLLYML